MGTMNAVATIDWREVFVPDTPVIEILLRGSLKVARSGIAVSRSGGARNADDEHRPKVAPARRRANVRRPRSEGDDMGTPQQPELHRSKRGDTDQEGKHLSQKGKDVRDAEGNVGSIPDENRPGHHPREEQDKPRRE